MVASSRNTATNTGSNLCEVLPIAPSTYYARRARALDPDKRCARAKRDEELRPKIERVSTENHAVYGCGGNSAASASWRHVAPSSG